MTKIEIFKSQLYPTGHQMHVAYTNNVLIKAEILRKLDTIFDDRFAITGGEDSHLFMRLYKSGYKLVWAHEAIVHESIPKSRTNAQWILRRGYHSYSTHSLIEKELYPSIKVQAIRIVKGFGRIIMGIFLVIPSLVQGKHAVINALLNIYRGVGTFAGLLGMHHQEYQTVDEV
ncbi:MAG: hypothetical protein F6K10_26675 [Moorea sp. SIO2B7]|nr:hypothetical protein [Moorena sp. SIO2B7]